MSKKLQTLFGALFIFTCSAISQNVYTVNNTPGVPADYHSLQTALDSVPAGSILLLQGSPLTYGYAGASKPVVIYGPGYFLGQNPTPNTQANTAKAMIAHLQFNNGSQGSIISGVSFVLAGNLDYPINQRLVFDSTSNITVSRCYFDYVPFGGFIHNRLFLFRYSSNITIKQSYMNLQESILVPIQSSGIVFSNNIIVGTGGVKFIDVYQQPYDYSFYNNSFFGNMGELNLAGGSFFNNVLIQSPLPGATYITANMTVADHNVSNINIFPQGSTNITDADGSNTFVGFSNPNIISQDGMWQLKPGSVAIGYSSGGGDCGAYGTNSYILSGIPAIPNIYFANTQQTATTPGGVQVHLKIKANN